MLLKSGDWEEIEARFKRIDGGDASSSTGTPRPPGVQALWPAIIDTYGVAEEAHAWPAQKLLDYGNPVLGSLSPGTVYVGGTDPGRWIPTSEHRKREIRRSAMISVVNLNQKLASHRQ
ncbi:MAG: hypothetical protein HYY23_00535 [Verrucomicrobia bacterium]|nr:hypothetical protein [Verrucomicrobiota bacterium]